MSGVGVLRCIRWESSANPRAHRLPTEPGWGGSQVIHHVWMGKRAVPGNEIQDGHSAETKGISGAFLFMNARCSGQEIEIVRNCGSHTTICSHCLGVLI